MIKADPRFQSIQASQDKADSRFQEIEGVLQSIMKQLTKQNWNAEELGETDRKKLV